MIPFEPLPPTSFLVKQERGVLNPRELKIFLAPSAAKREKGESGCQATSISSQFCLETDLWC